MTHDSYIPGLVGIVGISLILLIWIAWLFFGHMSVYETSTDFQLGSDGLLSVKFPDSALLRMQPGQQVEIYIKSGLAANNTMIKGELMNLPPYPGDPVQIFPMGELPQEGALKGEVKVLVGTISPAQMVWQSVGN
jgi:hypothetical protein